MLSAPGAEGSTAPIASWTRWLVRDHPPVSLGLAGLVVLAWLDLLRRAGILGLNSMGHAIAMPQAAAPLGVTDVVMTAAMWAIMMAAMMLPSAAPMLLLFSTVNRTRSVQGTPVIPAGIFLLGYLLIWGGFSLLATGAQWGLHTVMLLSPGLAVTNPLVSGLVLIAAGAYQFTPLKYVCLKQCQSPLDFLFTHWRDGKGGAFLMGLSHGGYCVGCCWVLMALLFVGGVMNLTWIALIAAFVLIERVVARGVLLSRVTGGLLVAWGLLLIWRG